MDSTLKSIAITRHGKKYNGVWDRMCNQGGFDSACFRWFIWEGTVEDMDNFIGDFASITEVERYLDTLTS